MSLPGDVSATAKAAAAAASNSAGTSRRAVVFGAGAGAAAAAAAAADKHSDAHSCSSFQENPMHLTLSPSQAVHCPFPPSCPVLVRPSCTSHGWPGSSGGVAANSSSSPYLARITSIYIDLASPTRATRYRVQRQRCDGASIDAKAPIAAAGNSSVAEKDLRYAPGCAVTIDSDYFRGPARHRQSGTVLSCLDRGDGSNVLYVVRVDTTADSASGEDGDESMGNRATATVPGAAVKYRPAEQSLVAAAAAAGAAVAAAPVAVRNNNEPAAANNEEEKTRHLIPADDNSPDTGDRRGGLRLLERKRSSLHVETAAANEDGETEEEEGDNSALSPTKKLRPSPESKGAGAAARDEEGKQDVGDGHDNEDDDRAVLRIDLVPGIDLAKVRDVLIGPDFSINKRMQARLSVTVRVLGLDDIISTEWTSSSSSSPNVDADMLVRNWVGLEAKGVVICGTEDKVYAASKVVLHLLSEKCYDEQQGTGIPGRRSKDDVKQDLGMMLRQTTIRALRDGAALEAKRRDEEEDSKPRASTTTPPPTEYDDVDDPQQGWSPLQTQETGTSEDKPSHDDYGPYVNGSQSTQSYSDGPPFHDIYVRHRPMHPTQGHGEREWSDIDSGSQYVGNGPGDGRHFSAMAQQYGHSAADIRDIDRHTRSSYGPVLDDLDGGGQGRHHYNHDHYHDHSGAYTQLPAPAQLMVGEDRYSATVWCPVDTVPAAKLFDKMVGIRGATLKELQHRLGCYNIAFRGIGSRSRGSYPGSNKSLHIIIEDRNREVVDDAARYVSGMVADIAADYQELRRSRMEDVTRKKREGRRLLSESARALILSDPCREEGEWKVPVRSPLGENRTFSRIIGEGGGRKQVLETTLACKVSIRGYHGDKAATAEPLHVIVSAAGADVAIAGAEDIAILLDDHASSSSQRQPRFKDSHDERPRRDTRVPRRDDQNNYRPSRAKFRTGGSKWETTIWRPINLPIEKLPFAFVKDCVIGPGGSKVRELENRFNVEVKIRGKGSASYEGNVDDPLHIIVRGRSREAVDAASLEVTDLLLQEPCSSLAAVRPTAAARARSAFKGEVQLRESADRLIMTGPFMDEDKWTVKVRSPLDEDVSFAMIIGKGGCNRKKYMKRLRRGRFQLRNFASDPHFNSKEPLHVVIASSDRALAVEVAAEVATRLDDIYNGRELKK